MKKIIFFCISMLMCILIVQAQRLIPFQYQNKSKWDYKSKWGLMTADRKIVLPPTYYSIAPSTTDESFIFLGNKIVEIKTGKTLWDSTETKDVGKIEGNIVSMRMPLRPNGYQPYGFKNIKTKKLIAENGRWASTDGFIVTEGSGAEGVVDEYGKEIIEKKIYQYISGDPKECFIATSEYNAYKYIYDVKGNKLNIESYDKIEVAGSKKQFLIAYKMIDKPKNIYELILMNATGKDIGQHFFCIKKENYFSPFEYISGGFIVTKKDVALYKNKDCNDASRISNKIIINQFGKIIIDDGSIKEIKETVNNLLAAKSEDLKTTTFYNFNGNVVFATSAFTNVDAISENLFFATDTVDSKKYFINNKVEKLVNGASFKTSDLVRYNNGMGFLIYKKEYNKLFFNGYNVKTGVSKYGEQIEMEAGITLNDISSTNGKYYLVNVADNNKKQYATYIYDINGKLVQKSEDGLWMYYEGLFIKYTLNTKGDRMYIGYYDNDLQPYSIIQE